MTMLESIKAVRDAVTQMDIMRESPNAHWTVEDVEDIVGAVWEKIEAAESAAAAQDAAYQRAREAFMVYVNCENKMAPDATESWSVLRDYFKGGE